MNKEALDPVRTMLLILSVLLFAFSLLSKAVPGYPGFAVLIMGWMEVTVIKEVGLLVAIVWFANPLLLMTWLIGTGRRRWRKVAMVLGSIASFLALYLFDSSYSANEAGTVSGRMPLTPGYALWTLSILAATARTFLPSSEEAYAEDGD